MNSNEEFDELARRKLEERAFPYQEGDWQAARALIDAGRKGRRIWPWALGTAVVLFSGSLWLGHSEAVRTAVPLAEARNAVATTSEEHSLPGTGEAAAVARAESEIIALHPIGQEPAAAPADHTGSPATTALAAMPSGQPQQTRPAAAPVREALAPHRPRPAAKEGRRTETPALITGNGHVERRVASNTERGSTTDAPQAGNAQDRPAAHAWETPVQEDAAETGEASHRPERPTPNTSGSTVKTTLLSVHDSTAQANGTGKPGTAAPTQARQDSTVQLVPTDPDTMAATSAPATPPIVPEHAPWEIGILVGISETRNRYSGGNSETWSDNLQAARSLSIGAELMHMGKYLGLGAGLHYGSYTERLHAPAVDRSNMSFLDHWYLLAVDTTILAITDTLPGTPPEYVGSPGPTTVNVLTQTTDTVIGQEHLRDARDQVNRVSYLEVPLLLDVHAVQGRWSLGLRGGPTLGLLTGRRGAVPNATGDGYLSFTEQPFRELVPGYTARAYVRYRFNAAWSVGIEPGMRGLLSNSLGEGTLVRRSSALGVMMSLSYRLR